MKFLVDKNVAGEEFRNLFGFCCLPAMTWGDCVAAFSGMFMR